MREVNLSTRVYDAMGYNGGSSASHHKLEAFNFGNKHNEEHERRKKVPAQIDFQPPMMAVAHK